MEQLLLLIAVVIIVALLVWVAFQIVLKPFLLLRFYQQQGIPTVPFRPVVGQLPEVRSGLAGKSSSDSAPLSTKPADLWPLIHRWGTEHGHVYAWCMGPTPRLTVSSPELIREVLITDAASYEKTKFAKKNLEILGNGLVLSEGSFWARQRRMINPAFNSGSIKRMLSIMETTTLDAMAIWTAGIEAIARSEQQQQEVEEEGDRSDGRDAPSPAPPPPSSNSPSSLSEFEIDAHRQLSLLTLNIIGKAAFGAAVAGAAAKNKGTGKDGDVLSSSRGENGVVRNGDGGEGRGEKEEGGEEDASDVYHAFSVLIETTMSLFFTGRALIPFYRHLPTADNKSIDESKEKIQRIGMRLIEMRRAAQKEGNAGEDFLGCMLEATDDATNERMTNQQLMDECMTFLLAGHETTAQLMTWCMFLLAQFPEWQDRLREEVLEVKKSHSSLSWDAISNLKWTTAVLYETLRLFPPVPFIGRRCVKDTTLGKYSIKAGTDFFLPFGLVHHDKELWGDDADDFKPERFKDGLLAATKHPQAFLAFSSGPRNCIGSSFALSEAKIMLALILSKFEWRLSPSYRHCPITTITFRPKFGMQLMMKPLEI